MNEKEQMMKEMIDELGGLLCKDEILVVMPAADGEVAASILDPRHTEYVTRVLSSRMGKGKKYGEV